MRGSFLIPCLLLLGCNADDPEGGPGWCTSTTSRTTGQFIVQETETFRPDGQRSFWLEQIFDVTGRGVSNSTRYGYDDQGRLTWARGIEDFGMGPTHTDLFYRYDRDGRLRIVDTATNDVPSQTDTYSYDDEGRLVRFFVDRLDDDRWDMVTTIAWSGSRMLMEETRTDEGVVMRREYAYPAPEPSLDVDMSMWFMGSETLEERRYDGEQLVELSRTEGDASTASEFYTYTAEGLLDTTLSVDRDGITRLAITTYDDAGHRVAVTSGVDTDGDYAIDEGESTQEWSWDCE